MLTIDQISEYFPEALRRKNPQGILVEYLQHELLKTGDTILVFSGWSRDVSCSEMFRFRLQA